MDTRIDWADEAWLTFQRLTPDVQAGLASRLVNLSKTYPSLYRDKPRQSEGVVTVAHLQVPAWGCYLAMETEYTIEAGTPVIFILRLEELSQREFEESVAQTRAKPGGIRR